MLLALLVACVVEQPSAADVTWHQDIAPIVAKNCESCHTEGNIAPFALDTPEAATPLAAMMANAVTTGRMPPWLTKETSSCTPPHPWSDDRRLSQDEIDKIVAWSNAGAPLGDPATAAPLPEPLPLGLPAPDEVIPFPEAFTVSGDRDIFQCFVLDLPNTEEMWVTGVQLEPGNPLVDHHGLVYLASDAAQIENLALDLDSVDSGGRAFTVADLAVGHQSEVDLPESTETSNLLSQ